MDGWIKLSENDEQAVKYVNRRNIVSVNDVGGGVVATMRNGDTVRLTELPPDEPKLPYDAEVEYIRTDGDEYILTGVVPDPTIRIEAQFKWLTINAQARLFSSNSGGSPAKEYSFYRGASFITARGGDAGTGATWWAGTNGTVYTLDYSAASATLNNTERVVPGAHPAGTIEFALFGRNNGGTVSYSDYKMVCDFYYMQMWLGDTLVRDFIPVRVGQTGYLYDRANPTGGPLGNGLYGDFSDGKGGITGFPANLVGPDNPSAQ